MGARFNLPGPVVVAIGFCPACLRHEGESFKVIGMNHRHSTHQSITKIRIVLPSTPSVGPNVGTMSTAIDNYVVVAASLMSNAGACGEVESGGGRCSATQGGKRRWGGLRSGSRCLQIGHPQAATLSFSQLARAGKSDCLLVQRTPSAAIHQAQRASSSPWLPQPELGDLAVAPHGEGRVL